MKSFLLFLTIVLLVSCRSWQDKDLSIQEIFINEAGESYIIIKNLGHTRIDEKNIDLTVTWDGNERQIFHLDSLDPHFRFPHDSSILKLGPKLFNEEHFVSASIDIKNSVMESDEVHNTYHRLLQHADTAGSDSIHIVSVQYPPIQRSFDKDAYFKLMHSQPYYESVVWHDAKGAYRLQEWPSIWKDKLLDAVAAIYINKTIHYDDTVPDSLSYEDAFNIFNRYIAHSLFIEKEKLTPWSVKDFETKDLSQLWNSENYFQYDSLHKYYSPDYQRAGGALIHHPLASYHFMRSLIADYGLNNTNESLSVLLDWCRGYLVHSERQGQIFYQSIPHTWYAKKGEVHRVYSCWATGGLIMDACRSMNIPFTKSTIELLNGLHSQLYFPTENKYIVHADDLYDPLFYSPGKEVSSWAMAFTKNEFDNLIDQKPYCIQDSCHTPGQQHTYDRRKILVQKALDAGSVSLAYRMYHDRSSFHSYLSGEEFPGLLKPIFESKEIESILKQISDWNLSHSQVISLHDRFEEGKNNIR